jgi:endonuclease-3
MNMKLKTEQVPASINKKHADKIFERLKKEYPNPKTALNFNTPLELLIATILSAQCTDARVNIVTKDLFKKYRTPQDYIKVPDEELEKDIHSTGFYKQKAKSIKLCCKELINKFSGKVPADFEALNALPGVGRKTASVVAGNAFGIPAIAVDTHVKRLSNRLGFMNSEDPEKIEFRLKELVPREDWINSSHWLIIHGRNICLAKKPKCLKCFLGDLCPSFNPANE